MRLDADTGLTPGESLCLLEQSPAVPTPLQVLTNRDTAKGRDGAIDIDPNHADGFTGDPEQKWMMAGSMLIGMVRIVPAAIAAELE